METEPHWEHGYRCHGYWLNHTRLGIVGLGPGRGTVKKYGYSWDFTPSGEMHGAGHLEGRCRTLRQAKRMVEKALLAWLKQKGKSC